MEKVLNYPEGESVVSANLNLSNIEVKSERKSKPTILFIPESTDKLTIEKSFIGINSTGTLESVKETLIFRYERQVELFGESFIVSEDEDGSISVFSRTWPLSGTGNGLNQAILDLQETITDLKLHYANTPIHQLDGRAILFRDFILSVNI